MSQKELTTLGQWDHLGTAGSSLHVLYAVRVEVVGCLPLRVSHCHLCSGVWVHGVLHLLLVEVLVASFLAVHAVHHASESCSLVLLQRVWVDLRQHP